MYEIIFLTERFYGFLNIRSFCANLLLACIRSVIVEMFRTHEEADDIYISMEFSFYVLIFLDIEGRVVVSHHFIDERLEWY